MKGCLLRFERGWKRNDIGVGEQVEKQAIGCFHPVYKGRRPRSPTRRGVANVLVLWGPD